MQKEFHQVTGLLWKGEEEMALYRQLKALAEQRGQSVSKTAKDLVKAGLRKKLAQPKINKEERTTCCTHPTCWKKILN